MLRYEAGGAEVPWDTFLARFRQTLEQPSWVLDGFASPTTFEEMVRRATVLVYVERPTLVHCWWVTKRLLLSPLVKPLGWPDNSPIWSATMASYRYLRLSHRFWTPEVKERLTSYRPSKRVHVIRASRDERALLGELAPAIGNR